MKDIAKKANTMYLLEKYNMKATKKFGQNFLIDLNVIQKIVACTPIDQQTCVIEIGPGKVLSGFIRKIDKSIKTYQVEDQASLEKTLMGLKGE